MLNDSERTLMLFIFAAQTTQQCEQTILCSLYSFVRLVHKFVYKFVHKHFLKASGPKMWYLKGIMLKFIALITIS